jgi:predicted phosphodiesterase
MRRYILVILISFVFIWSSCGEQKPVVHTFAVYGDSRTGHDVHVQIVGDIINKHPSVVFHTGDMVEDGNNPSLWQIFNKITWDLRKQVEFYPCLGNHENESPLYFKNFDYLDNQRWYAVNCYNIHFIVLDTNVDFKPGSEQYKWLSIELTKKYGLFTIVLFHHPPFSLTRQDEQTQDIRTYLVPLFDRYNVDIVFNGHDHNYQRFYVNKTYYIVTGGGGAPLYDREFDDPDCQKFLKVYNFCILQIEEGKLTINAFDINSSLIDSVDIDKYNRNFDLSNGYIFN